MRKPPERIEVPEGHEMRERFARILAVLIVVSTLGVATVEYLHSVADQNADHAGTDAQVIGVQRQGETVRADDSARTEVAAFAASAEESARAGNAFQQFLLPSVIEGSAQANLLKLEETRWTDLAAFTGQLTDIKASGNTAPAQDIRFPNLELTATQHESNRLFALQDASNQLRSDWQTRVGYLSVILTLFAVAIYLFGLSLTLQARVRRMLVGLGLLLVAVASVWTVSLQFGSPSAAPEAAATAYADGMTAMNSFYAQPGDTGLRAADADFTKSISLRPTFATAYLKRSLVRFLIGSPQRTDSVVSVTTPQALQAQGDDLQKAYELGDRDKELLNDLAANRLLLAFENNQPNQIGPALGYLADAMKLDSNDPLLYYNEGVAYLGEGNINAARQAYQQAVAHTVYTDVTRKVRRNDPAVEEGYAGGGLTPLDLLAHDRPALASQVAAMKELVIGGVDDTKVHSSTPPVQFTNAAVQVFGGELQWTANVAGYDANSQEVSTQWYYEGPAKLGWAVLEPVSGVSTPSPDSSGGVNGYYYITHYLQVAVQCLQPGNYRVEVYVNGHLSASAQTTAALPPLVAGAMPDVGTSMCRPPDWKTDTGSSTLQGFSNGLVNSDHSAGAYVLRFQNPSVPAGTDALTEAKAFRDEFFSLTGFLPSGASPQLQEELTDAYFLGFDGANEAYYDYDGGSLRIGSGVAADGAVIVGLVFGPTAQWNGDHSLGDAIFESMTSLG
jgi:tetratricopeptide (TPR) repeat protein